ncbi:siderophore-interacting protein [Corynebacterium sp.]|uniref:siderophore-interacting protein n=1 Tax=Corynebacterium sp. TaxID=1720 RepID=UPI0026DAA8A1|nr:siderophore-interacting protein [Corynebacterium sp.]MDO5031192.1 siderophore-interacting protein [Corynebacterium sp.]
MPYQPHLATVLDSTRISPSLQRVRLTGLDAMGPAGYIRDLRIKLILPGPDGLPQFPDRGDWYAAWQGLDPATRGHMRTYSVRDLDRTQGILTVDFVLHSEPGSEGPASTWATSTQPGARIYVIAPHAQDASGPGIEFHPAGATRAHLYGDETALPALARIAEEWPAGLTGSITVEVPHAADAQALPAREGLSIEFLPRAQREHGALLIDALSSHLGITPTACSERRPTASPLLWETPSYSSSGEATDPNPTRSGGTYWWIAGESGVVKRMRRMLVQGAGVERGNVSFMGYWKRGAAEG